MIAPVFAGDPMAGDSERVREARAVSAELGGKLKAQLEAAMKAGGPASALAVCNTVAPGIGADLSGTYGGDVGRTALKVRNASNAPDAFERGVLERFVSEAAKGADIAALEHSEVIEENGQRVLRYMKAIPMAEKPCAACHGQAVAPDLLDKIRALYPDDQAIGFTPGEVRGAFTISKKLQ
jgi:hypothetical protein